VPDDKNARLALRIDQLSVKAPDDRLLLQVDSLRIPQGELVCITGPSGAGKSTLLMAMAGLAEKAEGSVQWGDEELLSSSLTKRAEFRHDNLGIVFQDYLLFEELSALDNASLADAWDSSFRDSRSQTRRKLCHALLQKLGIDPQDQRSVMSHSGGERQRIAVARALASSPQIVLADEPTASLDRESADALIADLISLAQQSMQTLIVISHDAKVCDACDRVIALSDGRIASDRQQ